MKSPTSKALRSFASWSEQENGIAGLSTTTVALGAVVTALGIFLFIRERNLARAQEAVRIAAEAERLRTEVVESLAAQMPANTDLLSSFQGALAMAKAAQAQAETAKAQEATKVVGVSTAGAVALAAIFLFSDARLKTRVKKIGRSDSGLSVYSFVYCWDPQVTWQGVLAQVSLTPPHASAPEPGTVSSLLACPRPLIVQPIVI